MENESCRILLEYIQSILYDSHITAIDLESLDEEHKGLGQGLMELQNAIQKMELLTELTKKRQEWILVADMETRDILYCNREKVQEDGVSYCDTCTERLPCLDRILDVQNFEQVKEWDAESKDNTVYHVTSFQMEWRGKHACAHVIDDITNERQKTRRLTNKAYHDASTGIYNRLFFEETMKDILESGRKAALCYMDLDDLKYVNDHYGHLAGDEYIRKFTDTIRSHFRISDVFARIGGDEFCIIMENCPSEFAERKLKEARQHFMAGSSEMYPIGFSFGVAEVNRDGKETQTLEEILEQADTAMYQFKRKYKRVAENWKSGDDISM